MDDQVHKASGTGSGGRTGSVTFAQSGHMVSGDGEAPPAPDASERARAIDADEGEAETEAHPS